MKKNKNKLISIIALSCVGVIVAGSIPLSAYVAYSSYKQNILDNMKKMTLIPLMTSQRKNSFLLVLKLN